MQIPTRTSHVWQLSGGGGNRGDRGVAGRDSRSDLESGHHRDVDHPAGVQHHRRRRVRHWNLDGPGPNIATSGDSYSVPGLHLPLPRRDADVMSLRNGLLFIQNLFDIDI